MKKNVREYTIAWAVMLAVFNIAVVVWYAIGSSVLPGYKFTWDARVWISWASVNLMFPVHLICTRFAFSQGSVEDLFLRLPLIRKSYSACIWMAIAGIVCIAIPDCPGWITLILCVLVIVPSVMRLLKAKTAADLVSEVGKQVASQTMFVKRMTLEAQSLMDSTATPAIKAECKKVYESLRFSDPMSSEALKDVEDSIASRFAELSQAVSAADLAAVQSAAGAVVALVNDRNRLCKLSK